MAAAVGPCAASPAPSDRSVGPGDDLDLDGRHLREAQDRIGLPGVAGDARAVEAHRLLQRPAGGLDGAALHLVGDAVRIDDLAHVDGDHQPAHADVGRRPPPRRPPRNRRRSSCSARRRCRGRRRRACAESLQPARLAAASSTARARGSFRWRRRNASGSSPRSAASSSMNDSMANTLAKAPSVRSAEVRIGMVSRRWQVMLQAGKS